jgi:metal iron transporter
VSNLSVSFGKGVTQDRRFGLEFGNVEAHVVPMNKTSRTDEPLQGDGHNQNPNALSNDLTTNQDLNGIVNTRTRKSGEDSRIMTSSGPPAADVGVFILEPENGIERRGEANLAGTQQPSVASGQSPGEKNMTQVLGGEARRPRDGASSKGSGRGAIGLLGKGKEIFLTVGKFVGPGFMVSVAYSMFLSHHISSQSPIP